MDRKLTFILIGIIFWAIAAAFMHFLGPIVFDGSILQVAFWVINFLFPVIALPIIAKLTQRTKHDMLTPTVLIAIPAMTLDGLSITFDTLEITHVYANTPTLAGLTGGFLLFAFASFFFWAIIWHKP